MKTGCARFGLLCVALYFGACSSGESPVGRGTAIQLPDDAGNPYCDSTNAKAGDPCTVDCAIPCGFSGLGVKYCTCSGGSYWQCPCVPPDDWKGAATAPCCDTPDGTTTSLKDTPCHDEWAQCVGTDPNTGTPKGCACIKSPLGGMYWRCGSTNHWFVAEAGAKCG